MKIKCLMTCDQALSKTESYYVNCTVAPIHRNKFFSKIVIKYNYSWHRALLATKAHVQCLYDSSVSLIKRRAFVMFPPSIYLWACSWYLISFLPMWITRQMYKQNVGLPLRDKYFDLLKDLQTKRGKWFSNIEVCETLTMGPYHQWNFQKLVGLD